MVRAVMRLVRFLVLLALALLSGGPSVWAREPAGTDTGADWVDTSLTSPARRLFTPSSGALLVTTSDGMLRSDDAGDSWYQVGAGQNVVYVDPTNQDVLYATSTSDPLPRSSDGGSTWTPLMAGQPYTGKALDAIAASPIEPKILYVGLKLPGISDEYWLYRSNDTGSTWTQLFHSQNTLCGWGTQFIAPHPTDLNRLIFSAGCHAGRDFFEIVQQSTNQGQTFSEWYAVRQITGDAPTGFPRSLVGGQAAAPHRWYLSMNRDQRFGGSVLVRSDDDGASWDTILDYQGGGTFAQNTSEFSVSMAAMAYDPSTPNTVYVARNSAFPGFPPTPVTSGVTVTADGGQTWNDLGNQQTGTIADLALGIDGQFLFLATDRGVARMALSARGATAHHAR